MDHQKMFTGRMKLAKSTVIGGSPVFWNASFHSLEVNKQKRRDLMLLVGDVNLKLMGTVGVEVTSITAELNWIQAG
jgi:hypothetical protein